MGRPAFKPTAAMRRTVSVAAGAGMSHEEIAIGIGVSRNTLEKHFEAELSQVAYKRRLEVLNAMHNAARKGNVSAQRAYMALVPRAAPAPVPTQPAPAETTPTPMGLGKKEQANADAKVAQVGTDWDGVLPTITQIQ